jgi:type I restriction enzyme M protein
MLRSDPGYSAPQPPTPAKELLAEFWRLEKEADSLLKGLAE